MWRSLLNQWKSDAKLPKQSPEKNSPRKSAIPGSKFSIGNNFMLGSNENSNLTDHTPSNPSVKTMRSQVVIDTSVPNFSERVRHHYENSTGNNFILGRNENSNLTDRSPSNPSVETMRSQVVLSINPKWMRIVIIRLGEDIDPCKL